MLVDTVEFLRVGFVLYVLLILIWFGLAVVKFPSWLRDPSDKELPMFALKFCLVGSAAVGLIFGFVSFVLHGFSDELIGVICVIPMMGLYPFLMFVREAALSKLNVDAHEKG